jgi:hypothetical protein
VVGTAVWRVARRARSKVDVPATIIRPRSSLRLSAGGPGGSQ